MPAKLGLITVTTFLKGVTGTDIHQELEVAAGASVFVGQPVKLDATGKVVAAAADELLTNIIGTALQSRIATESVTIATRFRCITFGVSNALQVAGGMAFKAYAADNTLAGADGYSKYGVPTTPATQTIGYALDAAGAADEVIRVGLL